MPIETVKVSNIRDYLQAEVTVLERSKCRKHGEYYNNSHFVFQNGRSWKFEPLPKQYRTMQAKACFSNAQRLALRSPDLIYCEGFARAITGSQLVDAICFPYLLVLHGWCIDPQGRVIDPTWTGRRSRTVIGVDYFGIAFKEEYLEERLITTKTHWSLIDDWENKHPLYTAPVEQWRHPINDL